MRRMDLYTTIHKGLRAAMFTTAQGIARTDFNESAQSERALEAARHLLGLLDEHADHEDRVLMPLIARIGPSVFADLQADHNRVGGLQREMEQLLDRIAGATGEERVSLGQRLHEKMGRLIGEHLPHMDREETTANRLLQAHLTDDELKALHGQILGSIPAARLCEWAEILLPAISPLERAGMLAGLQVVLPAEAFSKVLAITTASGEHRNGSTVFERMSA